MRVNEVVNMLESFLIHPVILGNQAASKPSYPYIAINETSQYIPAAGHIENEPLPEDIKQVHISQPTLVLSVTAYSDTFQGVFDLSERAFGWFNFAGARDLKHAGFVVANIESITNRDTLIIDDYERRRGFDVTIRFVDRQERFVEEIKQVKGTLNNEPFETKKE